MAALPMDFAGVLNNCGFSAAARTVLLDPNQEDLDLDTLRTWVDDDVEQMAQTLRKVQVTVKDASGNDVQRPLYVKASALEHLKTVCYALRHSVRCGRTIDHTLFSPNNLRGWRDLRNIEEEHEEPDEMPKLTKSSNSAILAFIEEFPEKLVSIQAYRRRKRKHEMYNTKIAHNLFKTS